MPEDYNLPWILQFLENQNAQAIEDEKYPQGHNLREVTVTASNRPEDRMKANLQASVERRLLKDARDRYTLLRNMNQAQEGVAHNFGLPLIMGAASPLGVAGWTAGSAAAHDAASRIGPTAEKIVTGAELGLMALGAGAGAYAGGRALLNNTNWGRAYLLSRAIGRGKVRETPTFGNNTISYTIHSSAQPRYVYPLQQPSRSTLTEAERLGIPKGERNFKPKWHVANYPGYLLKGLMKGSLLEKQLSKNGTININQLNAYFNKASQIEREVANKVLAEQFAGLKIIDYNLFKKAVLNELVTYNVSSAQKYGSYGINRLGFDSPDTDLGIQRILIRKYPERFSLMKNDLDVIDRTFGTEYFVDRLLGMGWHSNSKFPLEVRDEYMSLISSSGELYPKVSVNLFSSPQIPKGNATHYDANTLGHSRTMVTPENPQTLYILESQSDWALKPLGLTKAEKTAIQNIDEQLKTGTPTGFSTLEELQVQKQAILDRASRRTLGISYLSLHLHDNYLQRQLQENLRYAAENGLTKMRYPTPETAAKIEGYLKSYPEPEYTMLKRKNEAYQLGFENGAITYERYLELTNKINQRLREIQGKGQLYAPEHQTILKKYADFPKLFLRLYKGLEVRTATDAKENTWYEVDVPKGYLNREWLFKFGGRFPKWFKNIKL